MAAKFTAFEAIDMTNYSNYPRHRLVPNSCIICFSEHIYSWTPLTEKQKKYMLTNYIDGAVRIDLKDKDGIEYSMSVTQFRKWIETGSIPKDVLEKKRKNLERSAHCAAALWCSALQSLVRSRAVNSMAARTSLSANTLHRMKPKSPKKETEKGAQV